LRAQIGEVPEWLNGTVC